MHQPVIAIETRMSYTYKTYVLYIVTCTQNCHVPCQEWPFLETFELRHDFVVLSLQEQFQFLAMPNSICIGIYLYRRSLHVYLSKTMAVHPFLSGFTI